MGSEGRDQVTGSVHAVLLPESSLFRMAQAMVNCPVQVQPMMPSVPLARCTAAIPRRVSTGKGQLATAYRHEICPWRFTHMVLTPSVHADVVEVSVTQEV